jgi:methyltransferase (TIGR00027 family)
MVIVAFEQHQPRPLVRDDLAERFLPRISRVLAYLARFCSLQREMFRLSEKHFPGLWAWILCRKRYFDDQVLDAIHAGLDAVVILGSGWDTRAYRIPPLRHIPVYEVDLPGNIRRKRRRLRKVLGAVPKHVRLVPIDFETQDVADVLAEAGCPVGAKTLFLWEAVTQYLTESGVRATFEALSKAPAGSRVVFTYVRRVFLDGLTLYGAQAAYREFVESLLWKFGMHPDQVPELLHQYGWREIEHVGHGELTKRYVQPSGRRLPASPVERIVTAEKTDERGCSTTPRSLANHAAGSGFDSAYRGSERPPSAVFRLLARTASIAIPAAGT